MKIDIHVTALFVAVCFLGDVTKSVADAADSEKIARLASDSAAGQWSAYKGKRPVEAVVFRLDCRGDSGLASSERPRFDALIPPCGPRRCSPDATRPSGPAVNSVAARFPVQGLVVIAAELAKAS